MGNTFENERNFLEREYNIDYKEENPAKVNIYLSISPEIHYQIQIDFENYPEKPSIMLPENLGNELGDPSKILYKIIEWDSKNPPHIVEIVRELEEILQRIIYPSDAMEEVMMEFKAHMIAPYNLQVTLISYKMKTYQFQIVHKKPNSPSLILSPELEKIIKLTELYTLQNWQQYRLIDICRELSKKIDYRIRILDELKQLERRNDYQKNILSSNKKELVIEIRIEIETDEYCELQIKLNEKFPLAPPNLELKNLSNDTIRDELNELLLSWYNEWERVNTIVEILDDIKNFLKRKSKGLCQICHQYECPKCQKPMTLIKIRGISGESECIQQCQSCYANFHRCCWVEQIKYNHKCPICLTQKTIFL